MAANPGSVRYAIITPVKNEERFIGQTMTSVISQSVLPDIWIIVDDASTDGTARIVGEYVRSHAWIQYLLYPGESARKTGSAEIHAFNSGFTAIRNREVDFIVKLDGDLRFDGHYFETLFSRFAANRNLGIASGIYLEETERSWKPVAMPGYHAAGASKVVRRTCFEQIGGFIAQRGWDTVDEIRAQTMGWETKHFNDVCFYHLRKEGVGMGQIHTNAMHGEIFYRLGGNFMLFVVKAIRRIFWGRPFIIAGGAMISGYVTALLRHDKLLVNRAEAQTYRHLLNRRIFTGVNRMLHPANPKGN